MQTSVKSSLFILLHELCDILHGNTLHYITLAFSKIHYICWFQEGYDSDYIETMNYCWFSELLSMTNDVHFGHFRPCTVFSPKIMIWGQNGPVQTKFCIWYLKVCYVPILTFHKDHFSTITSFLWPSVWILDVFAHVFCPKTMILGQNRPAQTKFCIRHLQKCYIPMLTFHKDHFGTIPSFLWPTVWIFNHFSHTFQPKPARSPLGGPARPLNIVRSRPNFFWCRFGRIDNFWEIPEKIGGVDLFLAQSSVHVQLSICR